MEIPPYWVKAAGECLTRDGRRLGVAVWGWGRDRAAAGHEAAGRLQRLLERIRRGEPFPPAYAYGSRPRREEIVQTVWGVEYHPLRHDAALFTNIMRIRRLLGRDGAELIRVGEDGYRFTPGRDFLFVEPIAG